MGTCHDVEITGAAVDTYARLLVATGRPLRTYGRPDGGLICEDRTRRARPTVWRILPDGEVLADSRYNYVLRTFVRAGLPSGI